MEPNEILEKELDKQFPKGDKARGRALVLNAIANIEIDKLKEKSISREEVEKIIDSISWARLPAERFKKELKQKLKEKS